MIAYPDFGEFAKNKSAVVKFLETMPILKNGDRSIKLELDLFEIRPLQDDTICPATSFWNLLDSCDEYLEIPPHNRLYFVDLLERSIGGMNGYINYTIHRAELSAWVMDVIGDKEISEKLRNSLYNTNTTGLFDIIWEDLQGIITSLILYGDTNDFSGGVEGDEYKLYSRIRKAYCAGGYPYGWTGDYPDKVKILVHFN